MAKQGRREGNVSLIQYTVLEWNWEWESRGEKREWEREKEKETLCPNL